MKAKKRIVTAVIALSLLVAGISVFWPEETYRSGLPIEKVVVEMQSGKTHAFQLEIAEKPVDIQIGLMYRKNMPRDSGMLFLMGRDPRMKSFWMKNTLIPLDMLFVGADGRIVNIHRQAVPGSLQGISSGAPVTAVIEINGGRADEVGIAIGDRVRHGYFR